MQTREKRRNQGKGILQEKKMVSNRSFNCQLFCFMIPAWQETRKSALRWNDILLFLLFLFPFLLFFLPLPFLFLSRTEYLVCVFIFIGIFKLPCPFAHWLICHSEPLEFILLSQPQFCLALLDLSLSHNLFFLNISSLLTWILVIFFFLDLISFFISVTKMRRTKAFHLILYFSKSNGVSYVQTIMQ